MKYRYIILLLLLIQQNTIQAKSSVANYIKSFFVSEEPSQKIIHKEYKDIHQLNIAHASGNVVIQTWKQDSVALEIIHTGTESFVEEANMSLQVFETTLIITTQTRLKSNNNTDLHIIIPENTSVTINLQKGDITIAQSNGDLDLYTEQGDLHITQGENNLIGKTSRGNITLYRDKNNSNSSIDLITEKGDIALYTTKTSNLDISAQTLKGKIYSTIPLTLHPLSMKINSKNLAELEKKISGFTGDPLSKTKLFCYTGNIRIEPYI